MKKKRASSRGMSPGSLVFTGKQNLEKAKICVFDYNATEFKETEIKDLNELKAFKESNKVSWLNITGLHDTRVIEKVGEVFEIHPLVLEDILNVQHFPKMEDYESYLFLISKMIDLNKINGLNIEQVSFILGKNFLITFQEDEEDVFNLIRDRLRNDKSRVRKMGADYLMYRLLDAIVDNYFLILDNLDERIERIEDKIFEDAGRTSIASMYILRKEVMRLKKAVLPLRDIIFSLEKDRESFIKKSTYLYLRDLSDHLKQFIDSLDNHREVMNGIIDVSLSNSSHKMNEIIKFLTVLSTLFIPLTFIVGIYGMNFKNMPELDWKYGYPAIMLLMLLITGGLIFYFKKKKWF